MEALLVQELGSEVLATLGGVSSKLAAMKAKLQGRCSAARLVCVEGLDARTLIAAVENDKVVAARCSRDDAKALWPAVAAKCAELATDDGVANDHVARGSFARHGADTHGFLDAR